MRVEFHPAALQELIDSARYYESRLPGLGADFKSEVDRSLDLLSGNPDIGVVVDAPYRRLLLDRFLLPSSTGPESRHCEFWQLPINAEARGTGKAVNNKLIEPENKSVTFSARKNICRPSPQAGTRDRLAGIG